MQVFYEDLSKLFKYTKTQAEVVKKITQYITAHSSIYGIVTELRMSHFLAQCLHESNYFTRLEENLNYSKDGLLKTFPKYFKSAAVAAAYARKPKLIASRVYANRLGNGPESTCDGWTYRGRGLIQLTGKNNYIKFFKWLGGAPDIVKNPSLLTQPNLAVLTAMYYWDTNNLNRLADKDDIKSITKKINGGLNGLQDRINIYNKIKPLIHNRI